MECCQSMQHCSYSAVRYEVQMEFLRHVFMSLFMWQRFIVDGGTLRVHQSHCLLGVCIFLSEPSIIDSIFSKM